MNHENLRVYQQLIALAEGFARRVTRWPRGYGYLADQARRAMASAVLTLAEGNAKRSSHAERRRFFEMSLGSIAEVSACAGLAHAFGLTRQSELETLKSNLKLASVRIDALP